MGRHKLFSYDAKVVRDKLNLAAETAAEIHVKEKSLIQILYQIDRKRFYVRYGFNSLMGFCQFSLKFSKTQAQRIVTAVRRYEPIDDFMEDDYRFEATH